MSTYDPKRTEYFREYMAKRRAKARENRLKTEPDYKPRPASWRASQRLRAFAGQATEAAARYWQPSIVSFLPESPRLEMEWRHMLAKVQQERGTQWSGISWAHL